MTLHGRDLQWYMRLIERRSINMPSPTLEETKQLLLDEFVQPKSKQQGVVEIREIQHMHGELT